MSEVRVYPVKNPEIVAEEQAAYLAKIENNKQVGMDVLSSEKWTPFKGWSVETTGKTFDTILVLDEASQKRVIERVVRPLQQLAEAHNITAIYAGSSDLPPHVVLQPGRGTDLTPGQIETIKNYLVSDKSHLNMLARILEGLTFHHDTLVIAPNSIICASEFNDEQGGAYRARRIVERIMTCALGNLQANSQAPVEGSFAPPFSYYDIFHSSVMRITEKAPVEKLLAFAQEAYSKVGEDLRRNPIPVTVGNLYRGIATNYQRNNAPELVIP